ncbi:Adenylate kinase 7 [Hypsibius exemplaris]|uniref:Adenylate kinase 7 n=1 Tax=Hypsibius exemplaris TaxID=2072580 RepID=A0A1W0X0B0_HYPEX|nr:Adenylate kinase 7 [Hypsibius exemplaris]
MSNSNENPSKSASKIVFISRAETYFGRILSQYFSHASLTPRTNQEKDDCNRQLLDMSFLDDDARTGVFKVFGTFRPENSLNPYEPSKRPPRVPGAVGICPADNLAQLGKMIVAADICIFHICDHDGLNELFEDTVTAMDVAANLACRERTPKTLLLVSTGMTWANTKKHGREFIPVVVSGENGENADGGLEEREEWPGFCEEEFWRRKPHPNFRKLLEIERQFVKLGEDSKGLIKAVVIASGVIYGYGENTFHWMFKEAWINSSAVPIVGKGHVHIPTIHARDLCQVVQAICLTPPRNPYVIAVDNGKATLEQIAQAISQSISDGSVHHKYPDEMLLKQEITAPQYDVLMTDILLEPTTVRDVMRFKWLAQSGILAAMPRLVEEYKIIRKTTVAKSLARDYKLHYVDVKALLKKGIEELEAVTKHAGKEEEERNVARETEAQQLLDSIESSKEKNGGRIADHYIMRFVREMLNSLPCQNQGFVLDGYPESYAAAKDLFTLRPHAGNGHGEDDGRFQDPAAVQATHDHSINPDCAILLDAPDDFLKQRVLSHSFTPTSPKEPPIEVAVMLRFAEYNYLTTDEDNVIGFFDETDIPVYVIDITQDKSEKMEKTLHTAMKRIGRPHNFPLTKAEKLSQLRQEAERRVLQSDQDAKEQAFRSKIEERNKERRCAQWRAELEMVFTEEKQKERSVPMKQYLMTYIFPVLIDGLTASVVARPADPVDFLAEFLLKHSRPLYLENNIPFTKMTAQTMRKRKKQADAIAVKKRLAEEELAAHASAVPVVEEPEALLLIVPPVS